MSSNAPSGNSAQNRVYTRFIKNIKRIRIVIYLILIFYSLVAAAPAFIFIRPESFLGVLLIFLFLAGSCSFVYISTEALIVFFDILNRIEENTRSISGSRRLNE
ncbi:hypothetical protein MiSe_42580 [Microseira wollei NIES-4236]|uniref:DUF4282 domain-containing protein n=1 Tax=Microseira wollei NIES-4236 TaxID=2530354 RepID=A0AAV3WIP7_9CYAN|nr:hypothetical protein MiSe_42580 [Microseira wollei NIES-4236]